MGEVEDAIRRREDAVRVAHAQQEDAAEAARQRKRSELIANVERLTPAALEGLQRAGWPNGQLIKVDGLFRSKEIAGFVAGYFEFLDKESGPSIKSPLTLLRDGRWIWSGGGKASSFGEIVSSFAGATEKPGSRLVHELPQGVEAALERLADLSASRVS